MILYTAFIYPEIPQELGGARPKKCRIEMKKENLSAETQDELFKDTINRILISKELLIYYMSNERVLCKTNSYYDDVYELNRKDIIAIHWE